MKRRHRWLHTIAETLGDYRAIEKDRVAKRIQRRQGGGLAERALRKADK
jgi:hypothetical protein